MRFWLYYKTTRQNLQAFYKNKCHFKNFLPFNVSPRPTFTTLNMAFNLAYELKLIDENPMHDVKIAAHVEKKGQNLSHEEQRAFLSSIIGHPSENYFKLLLARRRRSEILSQY